MYRNSSLSIIKVTKWFLFMVTVISVVLEVLFFLSFETAVGCVMMIVCHLVFSRFFLNKYYIMCHPFAFMIMITMFMYRYVPVLGTLLSFRPVTYGMEFPIKTFISETLFFLFFSLVFRFACANIKHSSFRAIYRRVGLFEKVDETDLWILGAIGLSVRIISFWNIGISVNAITNTFINFMYAPVILLFPFLYKEHYSSAINIKKVSVWLYILVLTIVNFGSNSRGNIITPFLIISLVYYLYLVINNVSLNKNINLKKIIIIVLVACFLLGTVQKISDAMLQVRAHRSEIGIVDLVKVTFDYAYNNAGIILNEPNNNEYVSTSYSQGWTEEYIDNFILNRYGNIRISDEVFYYSNGLEESSHKEIRDSFFSRLLCLFPEQILKILNIDINKNDYNYSSGDYLYYKSGYGNRYSLGGRRVTSFLPDGLATFGIWYIFFQMICFWCLFVVLKGLININKNNECQYSIFGILSFVKLFNLGMNSNGFIEILGYLLRVYWEGIIIYLVLIYVVHTAKKLLKKAR